MFVAVEPFRMNPEGVFIQALTETTRTPDSAPLAATITPASQCATRGHAVPAVDVDAQEDRLGEEGEPFQSEPQPDDRAGELHEAGPEQPQLERQHRARDRAHREQDRRTPGPSLRQGAVDRLARAEPDASDTAIISGSAIPATAKRIWKPSEIPIWSRAARRFDMVIPPVSSCSGRRRARSRWRTRPAFQGGDVSKSHARASRSRGRKGLISDASGGRCRSAGALSIGRKRFLASSASVQLRSRDLGG